MQPSSWIFDASRHSWFESVPGYLPKLEMQLFWNPVILCQIFCSSGSGFEKCVFMLGTFTKTIGPRASQDIYPLYMSMLSVGGNLSSWVSFENKMEENTKVSNKQMCKFYKLTGVNRIQTDQMTTNIYIFLFWDMKRRKYHWSKQNIIFWLKSINCRD